MATPSERLIKAIMGACPAQEKMEVWLSRELTALDKITSQIVQKERDKDRARKNLQQELDRIDSAIVLIQEKCPHYDHKFNGDPSGGSDSSHRCVICSKEFDHFLGGYSG